MEVPQGVQACLVLDCGTENRVEKAEVRTAHRADPNCARLGPQHFEWVRPFELNCVRSRML